DMKYPLRFVASPTAEAANWGEVRLLHTDGDQNSDAAFDFRFSRSETDVSEPGALQARPEKGTSYAHVPVTGHVAAASACSLPAGSYRFFARLGDRGTVLPTTAVAQGTVLDLRLKLLCRVQGRIRGSISGTRVLDVFARRVEDGVPVEAEGWTLRGVARS